LSDLTQGADTVGRLALGLFGKAAVLFVLSLSTQACSIGGKPAALDTMLTTASVPPASVFPDERLAADGQAILAALSSGTETGTPASLPWENPESGARGLITAYSGASEGECLAFTTTRESFDGIGLYEGEACKDPAGILRMRAFTQR